MQAEVCRADGLVRFLGVFGFGGITTRLFWQIVAAMIGANHIARSMVSFFSHLDAICTHISDASIFVELLSRLHGALGGEAQTTRGVLLKRGCNERRGRVALDRLGFDSLDREAILANHLKSSVSVCFVRNREFLELLAVQFNKSSFKTRAV